MKLWNEIKQAMLDTPEQTLVEKSKVLTYRKAVNEAEQFSKKLAGERCCAILCTSEMEAAIALLACFAAGVTAVPLSMRYGKQHCNKILDLIGPTAMIVDVDGALRVIRLPNATYKTPKEHPALIMCTSGTTGVPKGAMLSEENVLTNVGDICQYLKIGRKDKLLIARPLYHCAVLTGEFLTALFCGAGICFHSEAFDPQALLALIDKQQITAFGATPSLLGILSRVRKNGVADTLRTICVSGECMSADVGIRIKNAFSETAIYHVYGLTEACPRVSYLPPEQFALHPDCVGLPLRSVSVKILKEDGGIAAKGEDGILWVKGNNVMLGYYEAPELTAKAIQDGWLCTGDMAQITPEGFLKIKGRADDLIIRAGMNIYPQEVEGALKSDPRVREVFVYGTKNVNCGMQVNMKIAGDFESIGDVRQLCMELLPSFQIPTVIELVDQLPKNGSGKMVRRIEYEQA